jgi:hypothetical protein
MRACLYIVFCLVILACKEQSAAKPELEEDVYVDILVDLHIAETYIQQVSPAMQDSAAALTRAAIARLYGLKPEQMEQQIRLLQGDPKMHQEVYDRVIDRLDSLRQNEIRPDTVPTTPGTIDRNLN